MCVFAYVGREEEREDKVNPINTRSTFQSRIHGVTPLDPVKGGAGGDSATGVMEVKLKSGERRGYWVREEKTRLPVRQASIRAKINERDASVLLDTGAEASILSSNFARELGLTVDTLKKLECIGIGESVYQTEGRTTVKITIADHLVYKYDMWVGPLKGQDAILGMDFMVPAGVRLDLADGSVCMPDEVRVKFEGRKQLFNEHARQIHVDELYFVEPGSSVTIKIRQWGQQKLWIRRGTSWIPTVMCSRTGQPVGLKLTNVSTQRIIIHPHEQVGVWLDDGHLPRKPGFATMGSRRATEWGYLVFDATSDLPLPSDPVEEQYQGPMTDRREYPTPRSRLSRCRNTTELSPREEKPHRKNV